MQTCIIVLKLLSIIFFATNSYSSWDDSYKTISKVYSSSCCAQCNPPYCTYVICHDDASDSNPILANPNDQCLCHGKGGIKKFVRGNFVDESAFSENKNFSRDCAKGIYSEAVPESSNYQAPTNFETFDIYCKGSNQVALADAGVGDGMSFCKVENATGIQRYRYSKKTSNVVTYNHTYYCTDGSSDYVWKSSTSEVDTSRCPASSIMGHTVLDPKGKYSLRTGTAYTPTPIPTAAPTKAPTPRPTSTPQPTVTSTPVPSPSATFRAGCSEEDYVPAGNHHLFVTSLTVDPSTSYNELVRKCQQLANTAGLKLSYAPLISYQNFGAKQLMELNVNWDRSGAIYNRNILISNSWDELWSGQSLIQGIQYDEEGSSQINQYVFSGTQIFGSVSQNCNNWTNTFADALFGRTSDSSMGWIHLSIYPCSTSARLYCLSLNTACNK